MTEQLKDEIRTSKGSVLTDKARLRSYMLDMYSRDKERLETMNCIIDSDVLPAIYARREEYEMTYWVWSVIHECEKKLPNSLHGYLENCFLFWINLMVESPYSNLQWISPPKKKSASGKEKSVRIVKTGSKEKKVSVSVRQKSDNPIALRVDTSTHMSIVLKVWMVVMCCMTLSGCSYYGAQYHRFQTDPWTEQWYRLQRDWEMLTTVDSVWAAQEFPDAEVYTDSMGREVRVYGGQVLNGYGQPVTVNEYRYVNGDGMVRVHYGKVLVDLIWYWCVFAALPMGLIGLALLALKIFYRHGTK